MSATERTVVLHYLGYEREQGGILSVVRALAQQPAFESHLGMSRGFVPPATSGMPCVQFAGIDAENLGWKTFWRAREVAKEVREWLAADPRRVFHGHSRAGLAVALWLRWMGEKRFVVSVHCYGAKRWFYRWAARRLEGRVYWLSPAMKRHYRIDAGSDWRQCIPGCVLGSPASLRRPAAPGPRLRLGGVGALVPWKRWDLIVEALARLPQGVRDRVQFTHIGGDDGSVESVSYAGWLKKRTASGRMAGSCEWLGEIPNARERMGDFDVLVVASHREPFSIAMLEALFAGVPVLAANSGGARDVIGDGRNGWLFRSGDPGDLARMLTVLVESDLYQHATMDIEGLQRFTAAQVAGEWAKVYGGITDSAE